MQNEKSFSQAPPAHMTGAELQTLREACSLTREELGDLCNVAARTVKISAAQNNRWVVLDGLKAGEKVMVDGFQKLQMLPPGTPVKPVPWQAPGAAAAPAASAPASAAKP